MFYNKPIKQEYITSIHRVAQRIAVGSIRKGLLQRLEQSLFL